MIQNSEMKTEQKQKFNQKKKTQNPQKTEVKK